MSDIISTTPLFQQTSQPDSSCLFELASEQSGYFTAAQARECGFSWALLTHHARSGRFRRIRRGLYRYNAYPSSPREHVLAAWLAVGKQISVVSHESALELLGLSDVVPDAVHLTVPRSRRNRPRISGVKIHTTDRPISPGDRVSRAGICVTSATRSILDAAQNGTAPEQIEIAVSQALDQGLTTASYLRQDAGERSQRVATLIANILSSMRS